MQNEMSSPGLNLEHGFLKKIEKNQIMRQQQVKTEMERKEASKLFRKVGHQRSTKPTQQIYKPPWVGARPLQHSDKQFPVGSINSGNQVIKGVHFAAVDTNPVELKSALKRSKSFGGNEHLEFEKDGLPPEYLGLVKKALMEPNSLSSRQLMEVVTVLCNKAVESIQSSQPTAQMCFTIIEKENGETFLESLLNSCREWYNERDKLLRSPFLLTGASNGSRRWTAYVSFLMELYLRLKTYQRQLFVNKTVPISGSPVPSSVADNQKLTLVMLIFECCHIILKSTAAGNVVEIECLRSTLTTVGSQLETDSPDKMEKLMCSLRDSFLDPATSPPVRKTLLELIELRASHWVFDFPQSSYYFPYTSMVSRKITA